MLFSQHFLTCAGLLAIDVLVLFYRKHGDIPVAFPLLVTGLLFLTVPCSYAVLSVLVLRRLINFSGEWVWGTLLRSVLDGDGRKDQRKMMSLLAPPRDWTELSAFVLDGGPLGRNCFKVVVVLSNFFCIFLGVTSFSLSVLKQQPSWTEFCRIGPLWPRWWMPFLVVVFSLIVNLILWLWSSWHGKSRVVHSGVHRMVNDALDRKLLLREHGMLFAWAIVNAICEEMTSRGFNRWEYFLIWRDTHQSSLDDHAGRESSNFWQAAYFGLAHFYGVPSGWAGVGLTLVYGWLMGVLQDAGGGLLYPILTHTVADYWIFSQIARRR
jgi:hypothetical protein